MRGYQGRGGRRPRKMKMPTTTKGMLFAQEIKRSSEQFLSSILPQSHDTAQWCIPDMPNRHLRDNNMNRIPEAEDPQVEDMHRCLQDEAYNQQRISDAKNWEEAYNEMFKSFYECSAQTSSWGDPVKWDQDYKAPCVCNVVRTRVVVLVDILSTVIFLMGSLVKYILTSSYFLARKQRSIQFCECQKDQVRLIQLGYIGCSPKYPRTAFSIRLLRFHHILWKNSAITMFPFAKALDEFLDACNPLILVSGNAAGSGSFLSVRI